MDPRRIMGMMMMPPPFYMEDDHSQQRAVLDHFVPPRVAKAMDFLGQLAALRQRRIPASTEHEIEIVDQQALCPEEESTRDSALQLLARYFDGKLEHDPWEKLRLETLQKKNDPNDTSEATLLRCVACGPIKANPECPLCHGSGKLLVRAMPSTINSEEIEEIVNSKEN